MPGFFLLDKMTLPNRGDMQRIIFSNNGTLVDWSIDLNDFDEYAIQPSITASEDKIYIASCLPFNHKWIEIGTANAISSVVSVEIWNDNTWQPAVDVIDYTAASGATLARSGIIQFRPDIENGGWTRQRLSTEVTGIAALDIYEMYWARLTLSVTPTAAMTIKYIGNRFSKDVDLYAEYPDLNNSALKTAWAAGKTTWDDQHALAADYIMRRLVSSDIAMSPAQIIDWARFIPASVHKTAELIYGGFGPAMAENRNQARKLFDEAFNMKFFGIDDNSDGELSQLEQRKTTSEMSR